MSGLEPRTGRRTRGRAAARKRARRQWDGERARRGTRGRNLRGLLALLRPTARVWRRCCSRCVSARPPRSRRRCSPGSRSTRASTSTTRKCSCSSCWPSCSRRCWCGAHPRADLPRRVGRPARARRPAHPHLHAPAAPADRLLREPPRGRADLAHDQRRGGAGKPRHRLGGDALPGGPDADRRGRACSCTSTRSSRC